MNYSDNNSLCSFNPVDYIDLDTALAEEELASITHSSPRHEDNYRFSLKSMNDKDLDSFRRSLITPMSVNSKGNETNTRRWSQNSPTRNYMIKRQSTTSPTHSCGGSVTESVALFNTILNDDGVDLVQSDLKDFMSPYDMDELMSRPGSRLPNTTPSPQNVGRFNRDALVSRHSMQSTPRYTNIERESNLNDNILTATNMDTKDKVTPSISKPNTSRRGRKSSVDASVQTQSSVTARRLSTSAAAVQVDPKDNQNAILNERKQKMPSLLKLSQDQQIHPSPPATTRVKKSDDKRRWSSHTTNYADDIKDILAKQEITKNHRLSAINPLSSRYNHKSINNTNGSNTNNLLPSMRYTKEKRSSVDINANREPLEQRYSSSSRPIERRASQRNSLILDSSSETRQRSDQTLERRASNRNSLLLDQTKSKQVAEETPRSHDLSRHLSARSIRGSSNTTTSQIEPQPQQRSKLATSNRTASLGRRSSHGALSLINRDTNGSEKTRQEATRGQDITLSSRYVQRRSSHRDFTLSNPSSANISERRDSRDIGSSSIPHRRVQRRSSIQEPSTSTHYQSSSSTTAKNIKRLSYHGDYGSPPRIDTKLAEETTIEQQTIITKTEQQQRRARALSVPASSQPSNEQILKPSLMPVPVSRFRKHSNNSLSRYESVPENEVAPPAKEVRFSLQARGDSKHEEILPVSSRSTGGYSNSTASSSHSSGDIDYDPPTPPSSFIDRHDNMSKRRSMPSFPGKEAAPPPRLNRYGSYLARLKDTYETTPTVEETYVEPLRRQRVVSEDNESYKFQQRRQQHPQQSQNAVTESARQLLAQVQERRAKTAAILNGIYGS